MCVWYINLNINIYIYIYIFFVRTKKTTFLPFYLYDFEDMGLAPNMADRSLAPSEMAKSKAGEIFRDESVMTKGI